MKYRSYSTVLRRKLSWAYAFIVSTDLCGVPADVDHRVNLNLTGHLSIRRHTKETGTQVPVVNCPVKAIRVVFYLFFCLKQTVTRGDSNCCALRNRPHVFHPPAKVKSQIETLSRAIQMFVVQSNQHLSFPFIWSIICPSPSAYSRLEAMIFLLSSSESISTTLCACTANTWVNIRSPRTFPHHLSLLNELTIFQCWILKCCG